jgi:hypothetical protein
LVRTICFALLARFWADVIRRSQQAAPPPNCSRRGRIIRRIGGRPCRPTAHPRGKSCRRKPAPGEVILSKRHELGLLSNFAPTPFTFRGKRYASLEGFWQMMKYPEGDDDPRATFPGLHWAYTREQVAQLTAFDAKRAGDAAEKNMKQMGIAWVTFEGKRMEYRAPGRSAFYKIIVAATREKVRRTRMCKGFCWQRAIWF